MILWLLVGAIPALVLYLHSTSFEFKNNESVPENYIESTIGISIMITLCGYISAICIGANYIVLIYRNIRNKTL